MAKKPGGQSGKGFVKGKSGNPSGRPKVPEEFKELARTQSLPALKLCVQLMKDEDQATRDRLRAAELVMDRAWGKAPQASDVNLTMKGRISLEQLIAGEESIDDG